MSVIFILLTVSILVAGLFLVGFIWAVRKGQYDDDRSPAVRILLDDGVRVGKVNGEQGSVNGKEHASEHPPSVDPGSPAPAPTTHHTAQTAAS